MSQWRAINVFRRRLKHQVLHLSCINIISITAAVLHTVFKRILMKTYNFYNQELSFEDIVQKASEYQEGLLGKGQRYSDIFGLIPPDGKVLDYGCGFGLFTSLVAKKSIRVSGIDQSENEITIAKKLFAKQQNVKFSNKTITTFKSNTFDTVISNQVIEHVHNTGNYLKEINRVLKPGGSLVISIPNVTNPRYFLPPLSTRTSQYLTKVSRNILESYDKTRDHIHCWDAYHFTMLLGSCGFSFKKLIESEGVALPALASKFGLPQYIKTRTRFKGWSYTLVFLFEKKEDTNIQITD